MIHDALALTTTTKQQGRVAGTIDNKAQQYDNNKQHLKQPCNDNHRKNTNKQNKWCGRKLCARIPL